MRWPGLVFTLTLVHLCLYPWHFDFAATTRPLAAAAWPSGRSDWVDSVVNVLMYVPFGALVFPGRTNSNRFLVLQAAAGAALLSLSMEWLQAYIPGRVSSLRDLLLNTAGAVLGATGWQAARPRLTAYYRLGTTTPWFWMLIALWVTWQAFPFLPVLRWYKLTALLGSLTNPQVWWISAGDSLLAGAALWQVGAQGLVAPAVRAAAILGTSALAALAAGVNFDPARWTAAAVGCAAQAGWERRLSSRAFFALALSWIIGRQLLPWNWQETGHAFYWVPFGGSGDSVRDLYVRVLAGKMLLYTITIEAGWRGWRHAPRFAPVVMLLLVLALTEGLQTHLAGRVPETTDLVLTLAGAWLLTISDTGGALRPASGNDKLAATAAPEC